MRIESLRHTALTSPHSARIKEVARLKEPRRRRETGAFILEGKREFERAISAGIEIIELYLAPDLFTSPIDTAVISSLVEGGAPLYLCAVPVFKKIAYRESPDGILAVAKERRAALEDLFPTAGGQEPLFLIAEATEKPGNLGALLRSADAAGVNGFIVCNRRTDLYHPNVIRASMGALFTVPLAEAATEEVVHWLQARGIFTLAATPSAHKTYTAAPMKGPVAIVVGAEDHGLSDAWLKAADLCVRIPMRGAADSLNVSAAATLLLYEAVRQRG